MSQKDDLISRQAVMDALLELYEYQRDVDPSWAADLVRQGIFLAEKKIEDLPSAEPKKGKWIEVDDAPVRGYCSCCGWQAYMYEDDVVGMPYCPNCGAKMEGEYKWMT